MVLITRPYIIALPWVQGQRPWKAAELQLLFHWVALPQLLFVASVATLELPFSALRIHDSLLTRACPVTRFRH